MYVTAQRVQNERGDEGVHAFVYVHGEGNVPGLDWTAPDAGFVAEVHPGQLLLAARSISGERLAVRSYLDVAFPDSVVEHAASLLRRLIAAWPGALRWPMSWVADGIGGRFYAVSSGRDHTENELLELHAVLLPIVGDVVPRQLGQQPKPVPVAQPIVIVRRRTGRGFEFRVDDSSRTILESVGVPPPHAVVSASLEKYDDFERMTGHELEHQIVPLLTKLSVAQLDALGGAQVVEAGNVVWTSPGLLALRGASSNI